MNANTTTLNSFVSASLGQFFLLAPNGTGSSSANRDREIKLDFKESKNGIGISVQSSASNRLEKPGISVLHAGSVQIDRLIRDGQQIRASLAFWVGRIKQLSKEINDTTNALLQSGSLPMSPASNDFDRKFGRVLGLVEIEFDRFRDVYKRDLAKLPLVEKLAVEGQVGECPLREKEIDDVQTALRLLTEIEIQLGHATVERQVGKCPSRRTDIEVVRNPNQHITEVKRQVDPPATRKVGACSLRGEGIPMNDLSRQRSIGAGAVAALLGGLTVGIAVLFAKGILITSFALAASLIGGFGVLTLIALAIAICC